MMQAGLMSHLLANGPLTARIGARVSWTQRPQGEPLPAIVLYRIPGRRDLTMGGRSGLSETRVQVNALAADYLAAAEIAKLALKACDNLAGLTIAGVDFLGIFPDGDGDDFEGEPPNRLYRTRFDLRIVHTED